MCPHQSGVCHESAHENSVAISKTRLMKIRTKEDMGGCKTGEYEFMSEKSCSLLDTVGPLPGRFLQCGKLRKIPTLLPAYLREGFLSLSWGVSYLISEQPSYLKSRAVLLPYASFVASKGSV